MDADLFLTAQEKVWPAVVRELQAGRKTSHWIWYVFPQLADLGRSDRARRYGLSDLAGAGAYLSNPVLRARLVEVAELLLTHPDKTAEEILGSVDALKVRSSMTLFARVADAPDVFQRVLDTFYGGEICPISARAT